MLQHELAVNGHLWQLLDSVATVRAICPRHEGDRRGDVDHADGSGFAHDCRLLMPSDTGIMHRSICRRSSRPVYIDLPAVCQPQNMQ